MFNSQIVKLLNVSSSSISLATASTEDVADEILLVDDTLSITYDSMKNHLVDVNIMWTFEWFLTIKYTEQYCDFNYTLWLMLKTFHVVWKLKL